VRLTQFAGGCYTSSMEHSTTAQAPATILNVPNQLTIARLVLSVIFFVAMTFNWYLTALGLFLVAVATDWVDGYWARKYGQITQLGRILDPFADKVIVCGAFIFLAAVPPPRGEWLSASGIAAWMAVVVVARELLVTALRSFFEEGGTDFSAKWAGKWKMAVQCLAIGLSVYRLSYFNPAPPATWTAAPPQWLTVSLIVSVWGAILLTIYSGWGYVKAAFGLLRK
jgi:CDP-diacylglycerol--glycerol-3-phosphate 3-phosphatidyltransferase